MNSGSAVNNIGAVIRGIPTFMNIFLTGLVDSLSLHKCYSIIKGKNDNNIIFCIGRIFGANLFLLLGSVLIYSKGIEPGLILLNSVIGAVDGNVDGNGDVITPPPLSPPMSPPLSSPGFAADNQSILTVSSHAAYLVYHGIWVVPIFLICYLLSNVWYQELANLVFKNLRNLNSQSGIVTSFAETVYALVVWFFIFIQIQLYVNVIPTALDWLLRLIASKDVYIVTLTVGNAIYLVRNAVLIWGLIDMALVYAWYCFDNFWISSNIKPDTRFENIHIHWIYFLGFGSPYILLMTSIKSYFTRYALFLAIYPFSLLLGSVSDFKRPYENYKHTPMELRVFDYPKYLAHHAVDAVVSKIKSRINSKGGGGEKNTSFHKKHSP
jgi:hypothetical protein